MSNERPAPREWTPTTGFDTAMAFDCGISHHKRDYDGVLIRLLSPLGRYPLGTLNHREAAMVLRPDVAAMITTFKPIESPEEYFSEIEYLSPFEVRSLSSILLSQALDCGFMSLYPVPYGMEKRCSNIDLSNRATVDALMDEFAAFLRCVPMSRARQEIHKPPLIGGRSYTYEEGPFIHHESQPDIFNCIDVSDHLMIRGLGALIRATMLEQFDEFFENAAMSLWVALEASFEIVREILHAQGVEKPSATDAGRFIDKAFGYDSDVEGYFPDYWEDRIKTIHPASEFGVFPGAGLCLDDVWHLRIALINVYHYLVTGSVPEERKDEAAGAN